MGDVIVCLIITTAVFFVVKSLLKNKGGCKGCGGKCNGCGSSCKKNTLY